MTATRLVCVGDSITEGMCDDLRPDGHHVGWADRTAAALAARASDDGVWYANLAVRGKLLDGVVVEELPVAMSLEPSVITFHAGPNDVRQHLLPWVGRRLRGVSTGDGREPKDTALRQVLAAGSELDAHADRRGHDA